MFKNSSLNIKVQKRTDIAEGSPQFTYIIKLSGNAKYIQKYVGIPKF